MSHIFIVRILVFVLLSCFYTVGYAFTFNGKTSEELSTSDAAKVDESPVSESVIGKKSTGGFTINGQSINDKKPEPVKRTINDKYTTTTSDSNTKLDKVSLWDWLFGASTAREGKALPGVVNINTATSTELSKVKGIGPSKAAAIVAYRRARGNFESVNDLSKVKGIGDATVRKISPYVTVR